VHNAHQRLKVHGLSTKKGITFLIRLQWRKISQMRIIVILKSGGNIHHNSGFKIQNAHRLNRIILKFHGSWMIIGFVHQQNTKIYTKNQIGIVV